MDSDEFAKLDYYLSQIRSFGALRSSSLHVNMLQTTTESMKVGIDTLIRTKIRHSKELLSSEQIIQNLRQDCDRWEQFAHKSMTLVEEAHKKIAHLSQAVVKLIDHNEIPQNTGSVENIRNDVTEEPVVQIDERNEGVAQVYRCEECPKTFNKLAILYRHKVKIHGQHSTAAKQQKIKKAKKKLVAKKTKKRKNANDTLRILASLWAESFATENRTTDAEIDRV